MCNAWSDATWDLVRRRRLYSDRAMGKKEAKEKKLRKSVSRTFSSSRPGLERTESADQTGSAAEGPDDDFASALSRSSSGGERKRGSTQVSKHRSHGTPGPKSTSSRRATQRSTPARPLTRDLAGKYGDPATSQVILQGSNSAGSQNLSPGDSTLGTLLTTRSPRSESLPPVEQPSSCDTGHNAWLATKGSVQQSSVNRPANSEDAPVTPGPGKPCNGLSTGTRPKSTSSRRATQRSTPARPLTRDLAGKYGDPATSQVILQGSNSAGSQNLSPGDSTLGTLLTTRSPRSESLPPVEQPSSCDTGHNAWLATKGSVQQSSVNRPANSEDAPVTPGPGKPCNGLSTGTRYPVLGSTEHTG